MSLLCPYLTFVRNFLKFWVDSVLTCIDYVRSVLIFISLLEMAELQDCQNIENIEPGNIEPENIEAGEPDIQSEIQTLKNELKALVKYNKRLTRKTMEVTILLNQITNKARDLRTSRSALVRHNNFQNFDVPRSVRGSLNKVGTPSAENPVPEIARECGICLQEYSLESKRVAFSPCGHSSCQVCFRTGQFRRVCPYCRSEIRGAVTLQGIYWNQVEFCTVWNKSKLPMDFILTFLQNSEIILK